MREIACLRFTRYRGRVIRQRYVRSRGEYEKLAMMRWGTLRVDSSKL